MNQTKILQDKSLSSGLFFLDLLWAVEPRVVNWNLVTRGETGLALSLPDSMLLSQSSLFVFFFMVVETCR